GAAAQAPPEPLTSDNIRPTLWPKEVGVTPLKRLFEFPRWTFVALLVAVPSTLAGQGVTTAAMNGLITDQEGTPLVEANVVAVHVPSGTEYRAFTRSGGVFNLPNLRVGGPYRVTVTAIGFEPGTQDIANLNLAQNLRVDFKLIRQAV